MNSLAKLLLIIILLTCSCSKPEQGIFLVTRITLSGSVIHHYWTVGSCKVYIKNANEYPGPIPSAYDSSMTADPVGTFIFRNLAPGNYYLYAEGYDPIEGDTVTGSLFINLIAQPGENKLVDTILYVSE